MRLTRLLRNAQETLRGPSAARFEPPPNTLSLSKFVSRYSCVPAGSWSSRPVTLHGRIQAIRKQSSKLVFIDLTSAEHNISICFEHGFLQTDEAFDLARTGLDGATKGSFIEVEGVPRRLPNNTFQLMATRSTLLSVCQHRIPEQYTDVQKRMRNRHIDFLVNKKARETMLTRSKVVHKIREILHERNFVEVETPVLQASASGAAARPFKTDATIGHTLQLKIAPELALKRAVVGGFTRVFELGKCFRNERLSPRHNPEFTTCEYYEAFGTLSTLMVDTQSMLRKIERMLRDDLQQQKPVIFKTFEVIEFIPTLEAALKQPLPRTREALLKLFEARELPIPAKTTVSELLDKLGSIYIEPSCINPTFVINHPAELSPLAKSTDGIAHRFELFVNKVEIINAYEEENDPTLQREKFMAQAVESGRTGLTADEDDYCKVLEWGLPPTAGWGMGVDRLCMLLTKNQRINEVLLGGGILFQPFDKAASEHEERT